jgi:hypothetical protein
MPHHFAKLYSNHYHVSEKERDMEKRIENKVGTITGMLYSIVTLKVFFPFFRSPAEIVNSTKIDAPYPMPLNSDQCPCGCPPDNCTCCCSKADGCSHR